MSCRASCLQIVFHVGSALACIVALASGSSTRGEEAGGLTTIAKWDFGMGEDAQADRWPDGWTRLKDTKHPGFIPVVIDKKAIDGVDEAEAERFRRLMAKLVLGWQNGSSPWGVIPESIPPGVERFVEKTLLDPYLKIEMDGSSAEVYSPMIPVQDDSLYSLQIDIRSDSKDFEPGARLRFLDARSKLLYETRTPRVASDGQWATVRTSGAYEAPLGVAFIQIALSVEPRSPHALSGSYGFDRIRVVQMPKIQMQVDRTTRIYRPGETVQLRFLASGLKQGAVRVDLTLLDHNGQMLECESKELVSLHQTTPVAITGSSGRARWEGACEWRLRNLEPGFYEVVTQMKRANAIFFERSEYLAILAEPSSSEKDPRFGWTLDERVYSWGIDHLLALVKEGATGNIKLPVWFDAKQSSAQQTICETLDRVQTSGVRCVGIIHRPIQEPWMNASAISSPSQSISIEDPLAWQPLLEPVFRAMCVRLVNFQIGFDHDVQYASNPRYSISIELLKKILRRYGTEPSLVLAKSDWNEPPANPNIDRWQLTDESELAESEWREGVPEPKTRFPNWTCINPVSATRYSLVTRTHDLVARMLASIRPSQGISSIAWISDPFSDDVGFLSPNGMPREMFVPYRTLLDAIRNKDYVGEMELEHGSRNALLESEASSCMVVWSSKPVTEQLYLGDAVDAIDIWGRKVEVSRVETPFGPEHRFQVEKWPIILRGIDTKVAIWRMGLSLDQQRLDSVIGVPQKVQVQFNNPFSFGVSGRIELVAPQVLADEVAFETFDADPRSQVSIPIEVLLRPDATSQDSPVRVVANLNTSPPKRFSVAKVLRIGNDDVEFETSYRISDADELWLDIDAINHNEQPVSFDCQLFVPDRRNERVQINAVVDRKTRTVVVPNASELMQRTLWLRCMQIGTRRILNYRIVVEPEQSDDRETPPE